MDSRGSLLERARAASGAQGELLPVERVPVPVSPRDASDHTAARLFRDRPSDYVKIVEALSEGMPVSRVARLFGVGIGTIYQIKRREMPEVERGKQAAADKFSDLADAATDAALERLDDPDERAKIPFSQLGIVAGIATDKSQLLQGGATARVEISRQDGSDYERLIAEAVDADFRMVTDLEGCRAGQRRGDDAGAAGASGATGPDTVQDAGRIDHASDVPRDCLSGGYSRKLLEDNGCADGVPSGVSDDEPGSEPIDRETG